MKTISFGNYWQSNNSEKESIEWIILKETDDKRYVISKHCLNCAEYSKNNKKGWKNSYIREWLNNDFLNQAFSADEQEEIFLSDIMTNWGAWNGKIDSSSVAVQDKIFLPSIAEAILYFGGEIENDIFTEQKRIARPTQIAWNNGCVLLPLEYNKLKYTAIYKRDMKELFDENASFWHLQERGIGKLFQKNDNYEMDTAKLRWACPWYLRSGGNDNYIIREDGSIGLPYSVEAGHIGIRPAMWIKK